MDIASRRFERKVQEEDIKDFKRYSYLYEAGREETSQTSPRPRGESRAPALVLAGRPD